jgi:hypothetical protein
VDHLADGEGRQLLKVGKRTWCSAGKLDLHRAVVVNIEGDKVLIADPKCTIDFTGIVVSPSFSTSGANLFGIAVSKHLLYGAEV